MQSSLGRTCHVARLVGRFWSGAGYHGTRGALVLFFLLQRKYLGHFQVGSYRYRSLIEGLETL